MYTHITFVIDESGSMNPQQMDTIGGFNKLLAEQKAIPGRATISLVKFNSFATTVLAGADLKTAPELTPSTYSPSGSTALLDALGDAINSTGALLRGMKEEDRPARVVFVVITDGQENASGRFAKSQIRQMIEHQQSVYKWEFTFIGANMDAFAEAGAIGIPMAYAANYSGTKFGTENVYNLTSSKLGATRSVGASMSYTIAEQEALKNDVDVSTLPVDDTVSSTT